MMHGDWRQLVSLGEGDECRIQSPPSGSMPEATVRFPLRLVAWLTEAIQEGARLDPPAEAGGVLVGAISQASQSSTPDVSVELFLPIPCSHSEGPLYRLSESDREAMREQLTGVGVSSMVVGLYRTNFRRDVELDAADEDLAAELLPHPGSLFLIVQPDGGEGPQATLFLRGATSIGREPALTFPFDYVQLKGLRVPRAAVHQEPEAAAQTTSYPDGRSFSMMPANQEPPAQTAGPIHPPVLALLPARQAGRKWALAGGIAALLALAFAAGKTWIGRRPAASRPQATTTDVRSGMFGLKTAIEQDHLRITWNPRALPLDAREGALLITDGDRKTQVRMDASAVRQGSVEYYPRSSLLQLELRVANFSDMVMVAGLNVADRLGTPSPAAQIAKNEAPPQPLPPIEPVVSQPPRAPRRPASQGARTRQSTVSQRVRDPESPDSQRAAAPKQFQLPLSEQPPSTPVLAAAPVLAQAGGSPPGSLPQAAAPGLNPPPPASPTQSSTPPAQPAAAKPAALSTPRVQVAPPPADSPTDFAVPQVRERVLPTVPASVLRLVSPSVVVHVKVQIDDRGKVVKAESLTHGPALVDTLADAAVEAARHWQFAPARLGNESVASETVLNFTFARGNNE